MKEISVKVPGKLYIAGEYAVVSPKQPALLCTVDKFLTVSTTSSEMPCGTLTTNQSPKQFRWVYDDEGQVSSPEDADEEFELLWKTIEYTSRLAGQEAYFDIKIDSELDNEDGVKYGLGSSGAVTIGLVGNLLEQYNWHRDESDRNKSLIVFKLSAAIQHSLKMSGSYGDIAASSLTGVVYYQNFNHDWLDQQPMSTHQDLKRLVLNAWPDMIFRQVTMDPEWQLSVAWTGEPSDTDCMIDTSATPLTPAEQRIATQDLCQRSKNEVNTLKENMEKGEWGFFKHGLQANQKAIMDYTDKTGKPYMTETLKQSVSLAKDCGAASKVSGSGGGDCAIAISRDRSMKEDVEASWKAHGIEVLPVHFWKREEENYDQS